MARPDGPICAIDNVEMRPTKNGVNVCLDTREDDRIVPYQIFKADIWGCHLCGHEVYSGFGREPIAESWQPNFGEHLAHVNPAHHVKP